MPHLRVGKLNWFLALFTLSIGLGVSQTPLWLGMAIGIAYGIFVRVKQE